ncbi:hypothetical protein PPL_02753 [Heterostelium album PN500]|uniref:Uncharacterized protein n=1 Tax=Heterostelium pallidum (strain ATCC 26659 / Pp 5 / PN500) TaxID=670386 RepID=D3B2Y8_HETP5|nr:hypothetical protein PPL_02753 [Heterostelium album PN500]EFA83686.1 hypothetical protein PPL_02753 [Heterostelium album PN500]|eukprot:XP_020435803.1 hypothetical protein PPL_02753 [Heterostelium album PN500]
MWRSIEGDTGTSTTLSLDNRFYERYSLVPVRSGFATPRDPPASERVSS